MKVALLSISALVLGPLSALALTDLGTVATSTPYDPYIAPVKQTLSSLAGPTASMDKVKALMGKGRGFRYSHTEPYQAALPEVTAARKVGDCKDKALWLCDQLEDQNVRFVIGRMKRSSHIRHAWVLWNDGTEWWVLDCTLNFRPIQASKVAPGDYVPLYSWSKSGTFRHTPSSSLLAAASRKSEPVASKGVRRR
jgi:hypothetical protein